MSIAPEYPSEGFLLDEDRALRDLMKGIVVSDNENQTRNVEAWFGHPDQELREQKYPYVTVDLVEITEGIDRVHRGNLYIADPPAWWNFVPLEPPQVGYLTEMPTPVDLYYQVSTWARNPRHDRQILMQLITGGRTMLRAGWLMTADDKIRRLDFLGHVKRDREESGKRLFNNVFRLRVSSEVPWGVLSSYARVRNVDIVRVGAAAYPSNFEGKVALDDVQTVRTATVTVVDPLTVDIDGATTQTRSATPDTLNVGDIVRVSMDPLVETPSTLADYRIVVLGVEQEVAQ